MADPTTAAQLLMQMRKQGYSDARLLDSCVLGDDEAVVILYETRSRPDPDTGVMVQRRFAIATPGQQTAVTGGGVSTRWEDV